MRYPNEITDLSHFPELALMTQIVDKITTDLDLRVYHDGYKERIEALNRLHAEGGGCAGGGKETKEASGQEHDGGA